MIPGAFTTWLLDHWVISTGEHQGEPYSFRGFPYLLPIAEDDNAYKIVKKSSQCGMSELAVAATFFFLDSGRGNVFYGFPAELQMRDHVKSRVLPVLNSSPPLKAKVTGSESLSTIEFNNRFVFFRGCHNARQIKSVPASLLVLDEIDEMDEDTISVVERRLGASEHPSKQYFSTPSYPDVGIDAEFAKSNGCEWHIRCDHCDTIQVLDWEKNVENRGTNREPDVEVVCRKCHLPVNRLQRPDAATGWVPARPSVKEPTGYHVSKLFSPLANLNGLWKEYANPRRKQTFWNHDLGEAKAYEGQSLAEATLDAARGQARMLKSSRQPCTMGVDVGAKLMVRVSRQSDGRRYAVHIGEHSWEDLPKLMSGFNVACCVIDAEPELKKAEEFQEGYDTFRVWRAFYGDKDDLIKKKPKGRVEVSRTQAMVLVQESFGDGSNVLPADARDVPAYYDQMCAPQRGWRENKWGNMEVFFPRTSKADHHFHADLYDMIAGELGPSRLRVLDRRVF